jgi:hypothetical protein
MLILALLILGEPRAPLASPTDHQAAQVHRERPRQGDLKVGQDAPLFELKILGKDERFKLESNFGKRPTVLIFGSYT